MHDVYENEYAVFRYVLMVICECPLDVFWVVDNYNEKVDICK
jgi:hypothetical protein